MRTAVQWLAVATLPVLALACSSSSSEPPGSGTDAGDDGAIDSASPPGPDGSGPEGSTSPGSDASTDAGTGAPPDASGDGSSALPDAASSHEAGVDAGPPVVAVVVTSALGPEQGVNVVFEDGYGEVIATTYTDLLGQASAPVPAGSQVTVVMGTLTQPQIATIEAVAPGDVLAFYDASNDSSAVPVVSVAMADNASPPDGTASIQGQIGNCGISVPGTLSLYSGCEVAPGGQFPVLVIAQGGAADSYANLGYAFSKGNVLSTDGGVTGVTVPGPWYTTFGTASVSVSNPAAGAPYGGLSLSEIASGLSLEHNDNESFYSSPTATAQFPTYAAYDDAVQAEALEYEYQDFGLSISGIATREAADAGATGFDLSQALPLIDTLSINSTLPSQPILTWGSSAGSLASADGVIAQIMWNDSQGQTTIRGTWTIVAPATVNSITAPAVPNIVSNWVPSASAVYPTPIMAVVDADFITSYDQLRSMSSALPLTSNLIGGQTAADAPTLPVDGTLRYTAVTVNGD